MPDQDHKKSKLNFKIFPHGILLVLVLCVIFLTMISLVNPAAQGATVTPATTSTTSMIDAGSAATQPVDGAGTEEVLPPPTPEEIGSTNGIILWSTVLILILLAGTLRETLGRKSH